jgi:hypothetical protein
MKNIHQLYDYHNHIFINEIYSDNETYKLHFTNDYKIYRLLNLIS